MDFAQLEAFVVLCETENITRTSELLFKTQPAISSRIKLLEDELGFLLVNRSKGKKNISITPKGREFLAHAKKLLDMYREIGGAIGSLSNSLRVSTLSSLKVPVITDLCKKMILEEKTKITLLTHQTEEVYPMIANKILDVAFVSTAKAWRGVQCDPAFRQEFFVAAYCENPEPIKTISPNELDLRMEIYQNWGSGFVAWHDSKFGSGNFVIEVDSFDVMKNFLEKSDYWTILQKQNLEELQKYIPVQGYRLSEPPPARTTYMLTSSYPDKNSLQVLRKFKKYVAEYAVENGLV